ncbi:MAG: FAD-binding oxidoreductase [Vicingaceae bacterium]
MSTHFHPLKVKEIIKETINTVSILFDIPADLKESFNYQAGQYLTLKVNISGEEVRRSYSVSSSPKADEELKISSKMIEGGKMSTYLFRELAVGDTVEVMPPQGNFTLKEANPLVLFAAGSGITPIISLAKEALVSDDRQVYLYYGNRSTEEIIFKAELDQLKEKYSGRFLVQHFLSSDGERIDSDRVKSVVAGLQNEKADALFYICGPSQMIQATEAALQKSEVSEEQIKIEYFASPKTEKKETETASPTSSGNVNDIVVVLDDEEHEVSLNDGETILEGSERIGIDPPYSCQSGVCTTCKAKVESGEVEMENNFGLGQDEIDEGYALTCIGRPKTAGVKINWDEV